MKKIATLFILLIISKLSLQSQYLQCVGASTTKINGHDTIFIFAAEPQVRVSVDHTEVLWYKATDAATVIQSGTDYFYPESGEGYIVRIDDTLQQYFWVIDFSTLALTFSSIEVENDCEKATITLQGNFPKITYTNRNGGSSTLPRQVQVTYATLEWNGNEWAKKLKNEVHDLNTTIVAGTSYDFTTYKVEEDEIPKALGMSENSIESELITPKAVGIQAASTTTVRGTANAMITELERPVSATALAGSAPLEIFFEANGTPAIDYFQWRIYKDNEFVVQRTEPNQRYTFLDAANYTVKLFVTNAFDCADSAEINIAVSESEIKVPNVFTPNGDGVNDEFKVQYRSIAEFHIWIYNRWGKLVFETTDIDAGWNGKINGRNAAEGAYLYVIRAKGTDAKGNDYLSKNKYAKAQKNNSNKILGVYQLSGTINLLRGKK